MGNEVEIPDVPPASSPPTSFSSSSSYPPKLTSQTSGDASSPPPSRREGSTTDPYAMLGNEVPADQPPSPGGSQERERERESFKRQTVSAPLGNEVAPLVNDSSPLDIHGGTGGEVRREERSFERETSSGSLGNEVTPPRLNHLGNEMPVRVRGRGHQGGPQVATPLQAGSARDEPGGRPSAEFLGNEVSMPGRLGTGKQEVKVKTSQPQSPFSGLGNEVPMPGAPHNHPRVTGVEGSGLSGQPNTLPGGVDRERFGNEVLQSSDSGYTTVGSNSESVSVHTASSLASRRRRFTSDSSADSSAGQFSTNTATQQQAVGLETSSPVGRVWGAAEETKAPPNSRSPSPSSHGSADNNFSSGAEDDESLPPSVSRQPSYSSSNLSPSVTIQPYLQGPGSETPPSFISPPPAARTPSVDSQPPATVDSHVVSASQSLPISRGDEQQQRPLASQQSVNSEHLLPEVGGVSAGVGEGAAVDDEDNDLDSEEDEGGTIYCTTTLTMHAMTLHFVCYYLLNVWAAWVVHILQLICTYVICAYTPSVHSVALNNAERLLVPRVGSTAQPATPRLPLESSNPEESGEKRLEGGGTVDNDLTAPTPESPRAHSTSEPAITETSHSMPPGAVTQYCYV